ncbi:MAG: cytochrome c biogenesis protein ResB [Opitutus sp.]
MISLLRSVRDLFVSLRLTVTLLLLGMLLIFAATLDQVNLGTWAVQQKYFHSFIIYAPVGRFAVPVFPGGYLIGGLVLLNLIAAHVYRFAFTWRKFGIQLAHSGLILLLVGELLSGLWQRDYHMRLSDRETKNYGESYRDNELVVIDTSDATFDQVVAIPEGVVAKKASIQHPKLPFRVVPKTYYPNSMLQARTTAAPPEAVNQATAGFGETIVAIPQPVTYRPNESNTPTAFVEIVGSDKSVGVFLVSTQIVMPQEFSYMGRTWKIAMRPTRAYQPFSLTLLKFSHDRYPGTEIPKNFSSSLRLKTPNGHDDRDVLIYMNSPLRYAGVTVYQAGFENNDRTTILQVVRNPSWILPYIACALMSLGLSLQFGMHLFGFIRKRSAQLRNSSSATSQLPRPSPAVGSVPVASAVIAPRGVRP